MKYTDGNDGKKYVSIRVIQRLTHEEIADIRAYLKRMGEPSTDKAVRDFVVSCSEYIPHSGVYESDGE